MDNKRTKYFYETIDKNFTNRPVAYCRYYRKALTDKLMKVHHCAEKGCKRLNTKYKFE